MGRESDIGKGWWREREGGEGGEGEEKEEQEEKEKRKGRVMKKKGRKMTRSFFPF